MLLPDMTTGTRRAVAACLAWTASMQQTDVRPEHVLLGLIFEEEGKPAQLLARQQIELPAVYQALGTQPTSLLVLDELPERLDPYIQKLLYDARLLALELTGSPTVTTEHLLLALLDDSAAIRTILGSLGFDPEKLRGAFEAHGPPLALDEPLRLTDSLECQSIARILDANANRAREALRILEETARFHLNDGFLTRLAKELRHDLTQALQGAFPRNTLALARDTAHDVGTEILTASESYRPSLHAVVQANAQRLQEALRSLEEYGKVHSPELGRALEQIRYRSYTLERSLVRGQNARERLAQASLYLLVSKGSCAASIEWTIREAASGGVNIVQLREKNKTDRELLPIAREVRGVTQELGVLFIMNDRPDLARLAEADGVHLGQDDLDVFAARSILGPDSLVGISTHNCAQLQKAILDGADYVGVGPTFPSKTKSFDTLAGVDYVRHVAATTSLPAFAIGGIDPANVNDVVQAGLRRIAVGQAITQADEPADVARQLHAALTLSQKPHLE
jgi:thiamine-phosphate pyrophosphorylase